ncbi:hypothetical protein C9F11_37985 [Streptomyces sp. YIM 121038]|uniref:SLOG family protein n=1 Tax=Streptomyces sp. YIM 121038 TaxID=2136401 RepID=UPI00111008D4|nr:SLOG family protein [Streptomyces sp. YIM 121038]QCX81180.1 hypothetical protein C9F11_37985 [Streptomyces sp. YIM 121038]
MRPYRILVTGSRAWDDVLTVEGALAVACYQKVPAVIVHGACPNGADAIASRWTRTHRVIGLTEEMHPANWQWLGKRAGFVRNQLMVDLGADLVLAFIKDGSRGASHTAALAERAGIPVRRFEVHG